MKNSRETIRVNFKLTYRFLPVICPIARNDMMKFISALFMVGMLTSIARADVPACPTDVVINSCNQGVVYVYGNTAKELYDTMKVPAEEVKKYGYIRKDGVSMHCFRYIKTAYSPLCEKYSCNLVITDATTGEMGEWKFDCSARGH